MAGYDLDVCAHLVRIAHLFVGREETRYYLTGVFVEPCPTGGVNILATDGKAAIVLHDPTGVASRGRIVRLDKRIRKSYPRDGNHRLVAKAKTGRDVLDAALIVKNPSIERAALPEDFATRICTLSIQPDPEIDGTFPDMRRIISLSAPKPKRTMRRQDIAGAALLPFARASVALASLISGEKGASTALRIQPADYGDATIVNFAKPFLAFGLLMPLRFDPDGPNGVPEWYTLDKPGEAAS